MISDPVLVKIRLGISTKLIFMITVVTFAAIAAVTFIATDLFREESLTKVQEMNKDLAESLATQSFNVFKDSVDKVTLIAQTLTGSNQKVANAETLQIAQNIMRSNDELMSVGIYKPLSDGNFEELYFMSKDEVLAEFDLTMSDLKTKPMGQIVSTIKKKPTENLFLINSSPYFKKPILSLFFFTQENAITKEKWLVRCEIRQEFLIKLFSKKPHVMAYLTDSDGKLLVHSDAKIVLKNYDFSTYPIVQKAKEGQLSNHQMEFQDEQGISYLGAFKKVGFAGTSVIAQVETEKALAALNRVQYRSLLVTAIVLGLAFVFSFIFSESMTSPLGTLFHATEKIAQGNFDVHLKPQSSDEIGALTLAFSKMALGLQERDKLKNTFNKFHSKEIANKILSGEMKLGGEKKVATVFFSDIRNFTTMAEAMSADEVVRMLNEYMTEMVKIIQKHKGVVDKYVGDAIMALWGVPEATTDDAANSVRCALEMREALIKFNNKRRSRGAQEIKIGIGIHTGEVLAGNIGSEERLEYTVIGDTVNQASRIESANKDILSDILVSDTTHALIQNQKFTFGPALPIRVKGKADKIVVHQIIGFTDSAGNLKTVLTKDEQDRVNKSLEILNQKEEAEKPQLEHTAVAYTATHAIGHTATHVPTMTATVPMMSPHTVNQQHATSIGSMPQPVVSIAPMFSNPSMMGGGAPIVGGFSHSQSAQSMPQMTHAGHTQVPMEEYWYLVRDPATQQVEGPYSVNQMKVVAAQPGFMINQAHVFKDGDPEMVPITDLPGFSRRAPRPQMQPAGISLPSETIIRQASPSEWFVYGSDTKTYGPYTIQQLDQAMTAGNITRTTYVWRQGMQNWMYLYQVPGFDRRDDGQVA